MAIIVDFLVVAAFIILIACFLSPLREKRRKKRQEAQAKAEKEAQRTLTLQNSGPPLAHSFFSLVSDHLTRSCTRLAIR